MRCLTLAQQLSQMGETVQFICRMLPGNLIDTIESTGFPVHRLQNLIVDQQQDADQTIAAITTALKEKINWLIVDHYELDESWEIALRPYVKKIMVIDDLANRRHNCDLLLDQTFNRDAQDYISLVAKTCQLLLGSDYALLRSEFSRKRQQAQQKRQRTFAIKKVLISFGAADPENITGLLLQELMKQQPLNLQFDVIIGSHMKYYAQLCAQHYPDYIQIHKNVENMSDYMLDADIAVGAAGSTAWERCCLGLPTLLIVIADNQEKIARELNNRGAAKSLGKVTNLNMKAVIKILEQGAHQPDIFTRMSQSAMQICDGYGVKRVAAALQSVYARDGQAIYLRPANMADADIMLSWQQHPSTRQYARNPKPPTKDEHYQWMTKRLVDQNCIFHIIMHGSVPAGVLRLDRQMDDDNTYEISILTSPNCRQQGIGSGALQLIRRMFPEFNLRAEVLADNEVSQTLFAKSGYIVEDGIYINKARSI
jgi:UDP-2,4-diacetamido-2,4,6-trideoxy-beta-L-altropyranose hydrolase